MKRGRFVVIDGIDGVGKGVFLNELVEEARRDGKRIFDVHKFWDEHDYHPLPNNIIGNYDIAVTSEPTFIGVGKFVRKEMINKDAKNHGRNYSIDAVAQAYALDRFILYQNLLLPLLDADIDIFQSRSISSSLVYQRQSALDEGRDFSVEEILSLPGNAFCHRYKIDYLLITTIENVEEAVRRSQSREKDDGCTFENLTFQLKIKPHYENEQLRKIFEDNGTKVIYLDAGKSLEFSQEQSRKFYRKYLR